MRPAAAAKPPQEVNVRRITAADLPFSCPPPDAPVWDLHPRVFLQIDHQNPQQSCPYCGANYILSPTPAATPAGAGGNLGGKR